MTRETDNPDPTPEPADDLRRARFKRSLSEMDVVLSPYSFEIAFARVTTATEKSGELTGVQVMAIVDDVISSTEILQGVAESFR